MGQREEIERLIGEAYASLRLQEWGQFNKKVSELALYPRGLTTDIIKGKMAQVSEPRAMSLAYIHEAVTAFPVEGSSPQEVEVVKHEDLARWRRLLPESTIQAIMEQHRKVEVARKLERKIRIPQLNYLVPQLSKVEEEAKVLAIALDTDGWLEERRTGGDRIGRIDRIIYRWEYTVPAIGFETDNYKLTEHIANMLNTAVTPVKTVYLGKVTIMYRTVAWTSRAMRAIQLCEPHFIKWKDRARQYLEKYKRKPSQPIPK